MASSASLIAAASFGPEFASLGRKETPTKVNTASQRKRRSTGSLLSAVGTNVARRALLQRRNVQRERVQLRRLPSLGADELDAPVERAVLLRVVRDERSGEAVPVRHQTIGRDAVRDQVLAHGRR